jgi:hypothetical protein
MKKILIILSLLLTSCISRSTYTKNSISKNNSTLTQSPIDSNSTEPAPPSINVFDPNVFSPAEVFGVIIIVILLLCLVSFLPYYKKFIKKKRS